MAQCIAARLHRTQGAVTTDETDPYGATMVVGFVLISREAMQRSTGIFTARLRSGQQPAGRAIMLLARSAA